MRRHPQAAVAALSAALLCLLVPATASAAATLTIDPVTTKSITTAHLSGTVEIPADGVETYWCLEYADAGIENWSGFCYQGLVQPGEKADVEADLSGLKGGTSYEARLSTFNESEFVEEHSASVSFATDPATAPVVTADPATSVGATTAHFSGTIDPEGGNEDAEAGPLPVGWEFQVNREGEGWNAVASGGLSAAAAKGTDPVTVAADVTGLVPNSHYDFRLVARYAGLQEPSPEGGFATEAIGPEVFRETLWEQTQTSIQLNAKVNPHNSPLTDCHFEYGTGGALDQIAPCESPVEGDPYAPPSGEGVVIVSARLSGLALATAYDFRLVVASAAGSLEGDIRSFTTLEEASTSCSNEANRIRQHATHLSRCRAWEKASPEDKGNGDVVGDGFTTVAARDGAAVAFASRTPFGDTVGSGAAGQSQYVARRDAGGWSTRAITPRPQPEAVQTFFAGTFLQIYSDDLRRAIVWAYDLPDASGDMPLRNNIYVEDTGTRELRPVTVSPLEPTGLFDFNQITTWGISADARHVSFVTQVPFLPDAEPGVPNVYQWDDGVLSLAGILHDGEVPAGGSDLVPNNYRSAMSADGSRLVFTASSSYGPAQLFMRIDGTRSVWITQPELSDDEQNGSNPSPAQLEGVTPDGRTVFFSTGAGLVDEDVNGGTDLYRYVESGDPAEDGNLTLISREGEMAQGRVVGMSDDGERIYYQTFANTLLVWDHGTTRLISSDITQAGNFEERIGVMDSKPGLGRVTPDGETLVFSIDVGIRDMLGNTTNRTRQMYLYSLRNDALSCISCPPSPATRSIALRPDVTSGSPQPVNVGFRPRFLADGGQAFFSTEEALVPEDTNGVADVYEYDPVTGALGLLSSGKGSDPANFVDASASGDDVFLLTRQRLLSSDRDELVDVYDAREGSTLWVPPVGDTPACQGEDCQAPVIDRTGEVSIGSALATSGNVRKRARRCGKGKHKVLTRAGKTRCVKRRHQPKHHKPSQKRTDTDRRAGR